MLRTDYAQRLRRLKHEAPDLLSDYLLETVPLAGGIKRLSEHVKLHESTLRKWISEDPRLVHLLVIRLPRAHSRYLDRPRSNRVSYLPGARMYERALRAAESRAGLDIEELLDSPGAVLHEWE